MGKRLIIKGANFSQNAIPDIPPTGDIEITVVASPAGGGIVTGGGMYMEGAEVVITATPNVGYIFDGWSDGNTSESRTITVGSTSQTYTALFVVDPTPVGYGSIKLTGSENWEFSPSDNPNTYGYYNAFFINANVVNPKTYQVGNTFFFAEASCDNTYFNRNIQEIRASTNQPGFGYAAGDSSIFLRFTSEIATTVEALKQWLSSNNITIIYKQNT